MPPADPNTPARKRSPRTGASRPIAYYTGETYAVDDSYGYLVRRLHASLQRHMERRVQSLDLTALQLSLIHI